MSLNGAVALVAGASGGSAKTPALKSPNAVAQTLAVRTAERGSLWQKLSSPQMN